MAACLLCRSSRRLHILSGMGRGFAQCVVGKFDIEPDDRDDTVNLRQHLDDSLHASYRLHYNPSLYYHPERKSFLSESGLDDEDPHLATVAPSFWQQSNRYSVSSSRQLSSSKNTLLDLAFNKYPEPKTIEFPHQRIRTSYNVKFDTRAFLKCRPEYSSISFDLTQRPQPIEWKQVMNLFQKVMILRGTMKTSDISKFFMEFARVDSDKVSLVKTDRSFVILLRYSVENLCNFSLFELLDVLKSFVWLEMPHEHTVLGLYEVELSHRADEMTLEQLLLTADLWRCIGRKAPRFLKRLYDLVAFHHGQVSLPELVQLLYIIGEARQCPNILRQPIEQLIIKHLDQLQPEEVGTVCLGLFKSQTSLSEVVNRLVNKAHSLVGDMSDFAMVNVLKYLRFSYISHKPWLEAMTHEVPKRAPGMGVTGLMHVALACSALHYRNDRILDVVAERIPALASHCRSKDSCKLLWAFGTLGFPPDRNPDFYRSLTEALRQRKAEFYRYPEHLLTGLLGLAFVSQFPEDLIELALSPDFVSLSLKSKHMELKKDLFTLDGVVGLELPGWNGPRLSQELREEAKEMLWDFVQSDVCQKMEVKEAESALRQLLGGDEFVCKRMILPHMRSIDLEVHLDANGQPIPVDDISSQTANNNNNNGASKQVLGKMNLGVNVTDDLIAQLTNAKSQTIPKKSSPVVTSPCRVEPDAREMLFNTGVNLTNAITEMLTAPSSKRSVAHDGIFKLAIQLPGRNHYCHQSQQLLGLHAMKRRHLKLAGYKVVELHYQEWISMLRKSRTEKLAYLHCKVYNSIDDPNE
ncbi:FAST kinase domain-containing protein 5, mitochondrial [Stigmatopora nigra]